MSKTLFENKLYNASVNTDIIGNMTIRLENISEQADAYEIYVGKVTNRDYVNAFVSDYNSLLFKQVYRQYTAGVTVDEMTDAIVSLLTAKHKRLVCKFDGTTITAIEFKDAVIDCKALMSVNKEFSDFVNAVIKAYCIENAGVNRFKALFGTYCAKVNSADIRDFSDMFGYAYNGISGKKRLDANKAYRNIVNFIYAVNNGIKLADVTAEKFTKLEKAQTAPETIAHKLCEKAETAKALEKAQTAPETVKALEKCEKAVEKAKQAGRAHKKA